MGEEERNMVDGRELHVDTELHEREGSLVRGWPALLLALLMVSAAVYSFSPRPAPLFPATRVQPDNMLVNSVARQGSRLVLVGEQGKILTANDPEGPWRPAEVEPQRGSTLTRVLFVGEDIAVAVGHDGWILRSEDAGRSWREVGFDSQRSDPWLSLAGPYDGRLFALGAFGQYQVSTDLGRTWRELPLVRTAEDEEAAGDDPAMDPSSPDYDPFAAFDSGAGGQDFSSKHLYGMAQAADGSLFLAGERGLLARSVDGGRTWTVFEDIYAGSFYGVLPLPDGGVLAYGMRGNVFYTRDRGETWHRSRVPLEQSLFGGRVTDDGRVVLVGASNTKLVSTDGGESFALSSRRGPHDLVSMLPLGDGAWLKAGEGGVEVEGLRGPAMAVKEIEP